MLSEIPHKAHICLDVCNDFVLPEDWGFENRINTNYHMAFIKSGKGSYILGNKTELMEKGKIVFVSSGYCHSRTLNPENLPHITLIRFSIIDNLLQEPVIPKTEPFSFSYIPKEPSKYYFLFDMLADRYENTTATHGNQFTSIILTHILFEIYNDLYINNKPAIIDKRLQKSISFMERNIEKSISINELAAIAGLSKNYYRMLFYKCYGTNPKEFFINMKIGHAAQLLSETDYSIKEIAEKMGYYDQYAFSKQFKAITGKAPSETKKNKYRDSY